MFNRYNPKKKKSLAVNPFMNSEEVVSSRATRPPMSEPEDEPPPLPMADNGIGMVNQTEARKMLEANQQVQQSQQATPMFTPYQTALENYNKALMKPAEKQPLWKQALFTAFQTMSQIGTGKPNATGEFQLLGNAKKQQAVDEAGRVLAPLQQQRQFEQTEELRNAQIESIYDNTDIKRGKLENEQERTELSRERNKITIAKIQSDYDAKMKQLAQILQIEKEKAVQEGNKYDVEEVDGKLFKVYRNDPTKPMEAIIDPKTGKQAVNPSEVATEYTLSNGRKVMMTGADIAKTVEGEGRLAEAIRSNNMINEDRDAGRELERERIALTRERLQIEQQNFKAMMEHREKLRIAGDEQKLAAFDLSIAKAKANAKANLTDKDYRAIFGDY